MLKKIPLLAVVSLLVLFVVLYLQKHNSVGESEKGGNEQLASNRVPSISYTDILENDEFKRGMQQAVHHSDIEKAKALQEKALEIAFAAKLPEAQINLLSGQRGLSYMQFLAKRQLFSAAFERRYTSLEGIQDLKLIYPEAKDLFEKSDRLITDRDAAILKIAQELAAGNDDIAPFMNLAREQWLSLNHQ